MNFFKEEFNLVQVIKLFIMLVGGLIGLILLWMIYKKISGDVFIIYYVK
jgi:hypothetical protein